MSDPGTTLPSRPDAGSPSLQAPNPPNPLSLARIVRLARSEVALFHPLRSLASLLAQLVPQQSFNYLRTCLLRAAGMKIGARSRVLGPFKITGSLFPDAHLIIGRETVIGGPVHVDLGASVTIGDRVHIGHHVVLLTVGHEIGSAQERCGQHIIGPIHVGDGAWIGSKVMILPGVTVGAGAVVAAGALVNRDVEPNTLVGGVPARKIRDLD